MNLRENPISWSLSFGTWFDTRVRVSVFFPLIVLTICLHLKDLRLGLVVSAILFVSVLLHEFAHILAARLSGGSGNEILIWPLGGIASVQSASSFQSQFFTPAAGPLLNLAICVMTVIPVYSSNVLGTALNPLDFPAVGLATTPVQNLQILIFAVNWRLFVLNLLPVYPLDGGRMLQACLRLRWRSETSNHIYLYVGFFAGLLGMFIGLMIEHVWLVFLGAVVMLLNLHETFQMRTSEAYDDSFMGYDFSQGYTSLERDEPVQSERRPGLLQRWREKRRLAKNRRRSERDAEAERQLDMLLEKINNSGYDSLTVAERRQLNRASNRYRNRNAPDQ